MAIDPTNPLLNGPKRVNKAPLVREKDYKLLYEKALERIEALERRMRKGSERKVVRQLRELDRGVKASPAHNRPVQSNPERRYTEAEIERGRSPRGGWTRKTLAGWGVSWPPPKGWKDRLTGRFSVTGPDDRRTSPSQPAGDLRSAKRDEPKAGSR